MIPRDTETTPGANHFVHKRERIQDPRAAVNDIAYKHGGATLRVTISDPLPGMLARIVPELVEKVGQFVAAAMEVADDIDCPDVLGIAGQAAPYDVDR